MEAEEIGLARGAPAQENVLVRVGGRERLDAHGERRRLEYDVVILHRVEEVRAKRGLTRRHDADEIELKPRGARSEWISAWRGGLAGNGVPSTIDHG